ncbi:MAG TPA: hypothetical protein VHJ37_13635 [Thermoleophilaceae bacterium]|nr:hypothetical protein [Thermoleophilaceae bacterium]
MKRRRPARDLRTAIDCLPLATRRAMLDGVEQNRIIVGAYTDRAGGVCPMLAAHRNGGRTSLASFAHAWDRYTGARGRPRAASGRELNTLTAMLQASILLEETPALPPPAAGPAPLRRRPRRATGERHRVAELRHQPGWAWLRPFRRLDEYKRALAELERAGAAARERELV